MEISTDVVVNVLGACVFLIFVAILLMKFVMHIYIPFTESREFIKLEIVKARGNARVHWQHELRRLYMGMIPLIGGYLVRKSRERGKKQRERL